jgi:hypothetical protein
VLQRSAAVRGGDSPLLEFEVVTTSRCMIRASTCCMRLSYDNENMRRNVAERLGHTHRKARKLLTGDDLFDEGHLKSCFL